MSPILMSVSNEATRKAGVLIIGNSAETAKSNLHPNKVKDKVPTKDADETMKEDDDSCRTYTTHHEVFVSSSSQLSQYPGDDEKQTESKSKAPESLPEKQATTNSVAPKRGDSYDEESLDLESCLPALAENASSKNSGLKTHDRHGAAGAVRESLTMSMKKEEAQKKYGPNIYSRNEYAFVIVVGCVLSFNTGYINGSCLSSLITKSGVGYATAGFTSTYTLSAQLLAEGEMRRFGTTSCLILSFLFGAVIAGAMTPDPKPYQLQPTYGPTFLIGGCFLVISSILATLGDEIYFFYFAAAAAGVQNGISSLYSANLIRSTGLTGTTTDIGLILGQMSRGNTKQFWKLIVLGCLCLSFWFGGFVSLYATERFTIHSLLFNAGLFMLIGLSLILFLMHNLSISFRSALFGTWKWKRAMDKWVQSAHYFSNESSCFGPDGVLRTGDSLHKLFDRIDVDGNGVIDTNELTIALSVVGISKTDAKIIMKHVDTNRDGVISREEWNDACKTMCN